VVARLLDRVDARTIKVVEFRLHQMALGSGSCAFYKNVLAEDVLAEMRGILSHFSQGRFAGRSYLSSFR
jgi:hypothetical protein